MKRLTFLTLGAIAAITLSAACGGGGEKDTFPPLTAFPPEQSATIRTLQGRVAAIRGLESDQKTQVGSITPQALKDWASTLNDDLDEADQLRLDRYSVAFKKLHMIGPEHDLNTLTEQFYGEGIAGLYFPEHNRLVLIGERPSLSINDEFVLSHEFAHSAQFKAFNIKKLNKLAKDETREYTTTIDCVIEGDAVVTSVVYMNEIHGDGWLDQVIAIEEQEGEVGGGLPPAFERYAHFNYNECVTFVAIVYGQEGWDGVNRLYEKPPVSTEQILHPEKYFAREFPTPMAANDLTNGLSGWQRAESVIFGEFDVYNYLFTVGGNEIASVVAAAGWGSGWINIYERTAAPGDVLLHLQLDWDTAADLDQFKTIYNDVLAKLPNRNRGWSQDGNIWSWEGESSEFGSVYWDAARKRVDIIVAPDGDSLAQARDALKPPAQTQVAR